MKPLFRVCSFGVIRTWITPKECTLSQNITHCHYLTQLNQGHLTFKSFWPIMEIKKIMHVLLEAENYTYIMYMQ